MSRSNDLTPYTPGRLTAAMKIGRRLGHDWPTRLERAWLELIYDPDDWIGRSWANARQACPWIPPYTIREGGLVYTARHDGAIVVSAGGNWVAIVMTQGACSIGGYGTLRDLAKVARGVTTIEPTPCYDAQSWGTAVAHAKGFAPTAPPPEGMQPDLYAMGLRAWHESEHARRAAEALARVSRR